MKFRYITVYQIRGVIHNPVETDIQEFIRIKKVRDALFHDTSGADKGLPTTATVELLKKYLRLHIKHKGRLTTPSTQTRH